MLLNSLEENIDYLYKKLPLDKSFDFVCRHLTFGKIKGFLITLNGLCNMDSLLDVCTKIENTKNIDSTMDSQLRYAQIDLSEDWNEIIENILSGPAVLFLENSNVAYIIDTRTYPSRGIAEPETETVTKGAHEGFVETLLTNATLIRRRIKSPDLIFEIEKVGKVSSTDVAIAYMDNNVNHKLLDYLKDKLSGLQVSTLTMGAKSLSELLLPRKWFHPMPSIFMTERPDVACSYLTEGHILICVDNSPNVLILPCTIFQFTQCMEDYYKSPLAGTYFRFIRFLCIPISLLLMPTFMLITAFLPELSEKMQLITSGDYGPVRIIFYVYAMELLLDLFKYASSLTSGHFSGSMSIVGGLIIGDVAITLKWASLEILFYGAITLLATLSIFNLDFSEAIRMYRAFLIIITSILGVKGYCIGLALIALSIITTPTFGGFSYFWPLLPFNAKALQRLLFRTSSYGAQPIKSWSRGKPKK